jgi:hypothetical protein
MTFCRNAAQAADLTSVGRHLPHLILRTAVVLTSGRLSS